MKLKIILLATSLTTIVCQASQQNEILPEEAILTLNESYKQKFREYRGYQIIDQQCRLAGCLINDDMLFDQLRSYCNNDNDIQLRSVLPREKNESYFSWLTRLKSETPRIYRFSFDPENAEAQKESYRKILLYMLRYDEEDKIKQKIEKTRRKAVEEARIKVAKAALIKDAEVLRKARRKARRKAAEEGTIKEDEDARIKAEQFFDAQKDAQNSSD